VLKKELGALPLGESRQLWVGPNEESNPSLRR